jgi:hypothetical protein
MEALQRVKLHGFQMVISELEVEQRLPAPCEALFGRVIGFRPRVHIQRASRSDNGKASTFFQKPTGQQAQPE